MISQKALPRYGEAFLRLFYPSLCASCDQLLELKDQGLCFACHKNLEKFKLSSSKERIRTSLPYGDSTWTLFHYEGIVKEIFHQIKFGKRRDLLQIFTPFIESFFTERANPLFSYDLILAVPLDLRRRLKREFNQSDIIASRIRQILGKRLTSPQFFLEKIILTKQRSTPPQSLLGRKERLLNLGQVFRVLHPLFVRGKSILLVDDIFTTGATLEEAAKVLRESGASGIDYFVLARSLGD